MIRPSARIDSERSTTACMGSDGRFRTRCDLCVDERHEHYRVSFFKILFCRLRPIFLSAEAVRVRGYAVFTDDNRLGGSDDAVSAGGCGFCSLRFVFLPLFAFLIRDLLYGGYLGRLELSINFARYSPVFELLQEKICCGVPSNITRPPPEPPSGPMSMIQSA